MQKVEKILSYIKENKVFEAQKMVIKYFKDNPGLFYYYLGLINLKKEDYMSALVCLRTARKNDIKSHLLSYNISICYVKLNKNDLAKKELIETIKKDPKFFNAYTNLCNLYLKDNSSKEAYRTIRYGQASLKDDKEKLNKLIEIEKNLFSNGYIK
ncbi:tetratricopeptide repeat protein [Clostridium cylindrosporum]|uniref:Uncharacterized protein n=1 Tax=Clostridium cylindrosporum DSM 605 TaxID=1121307 RepID=A0A0J8DBQ5_CLOCY|nr:hypothetical protein [Clostridium cylindrosporum]KMT21723.1 hypothetical protein CLCY_2c04850 [Clostridium cylindrosporum DSM 605]